MMTASSFPAPVVIIPLNSYIPTNAEINISRNFFNYCDPHFD